MDAVDYEALQRPFPRESIRTRRGAGNNVISYIACHDVIRRVIDSTGNNYGFRVLAIDMQDGLVMATVELEIGGSVRQHIGTQRMNGGNDDDVVKAAISDGLKKAATLFGVGLELYSTDSENAPAPAPRPAQTAPQNAPQGGNNGGYRRANQVRSGGFRPLQSQA